MITATVKAVKLDLKGYRKEIQQIIQYQVQQATREWLRAVALKVPVYTGMAKGSLLPLSRFLGEALSISPIAKRSYGNIASGEALGIYGFKQDGDKYTFSFSTEVPHYLINEFNVGLGSPPLRHPTPWNSFAAGEAAWLKYLNEELVDKLPDLIDFVTFKTVQ